MSKNNWEAGKQFDLGEKVFSEIEIIDYAREHDPLDFHLSRQAANESRFKGLVTSGGQAFDHFYVQSWVPRFGESVVAGLGIKEWNFLAPIYAGDTIYGSCKLSKTKDTKDPDTVVNHWDFEFKNQDGTLVQNLHLIVLHRK